MKKVRITDLDIIRAQTPSKLNLTVTSIRFTLYPASMACIGLESPQSVQVFVAPKTNSSPKKNLLFCIFNFFFKKRRRRRREFGHYFLIFCVVSKKKVFHFEGHYSIHRLSSGQIFKIRTQQNA